MELLESYGHKERLVCRTFFFWLRMSDVSSVPHLQSCTQEQSAIPKPALHSYADDFLAPRVYPSHPPPLFCAQRVNYFFQHFTLMFQCFPLPTKYTPDFPTRCMPVYVHTHSHTRAHAFPFTSPLAVSLTQLGLCIPSHQ